MDDIKPDESIGNEDGLVGLTHKPESDTGMDEEETNSPAPATWGYPSTVFPLLAGTFGPMANAFSICALAGNWKVGEPNAGDNNDIQDSPGLVAANAVSLVLALATNLALLLHMARRLCFAVAQPITILGFWCASILLIGPIAKAAHDTHSAQVRSQVLTQAYYYAITYVTVNLSLFM